MKVVIFSNGDLEDYANIESYVANYDCVICADGGIRHADALDIIPDLIVGDLDSASADLLDRCRELGARIDSFPTEKDYTDTQIAVDTAVNMNPDEIILAGALGDRWDHSYANVMLLYRIATRGIEGWIVDDKNAMTVSNSRLVLRGDRGQILSLLPFNGDAHVEFTSGLKYPILQKTLYIDYPLGVSNVFIEEKAEIAIKSGWILAIKAHD